MIDNTSTSCYIYKRDCQKGGLFCFAGRSRAVRPVLCVIIYIINKNFSKYFKKMLDKYPETWYNISTKEMEVLLWHNIILLFSIPKGKKLNGYPNTIGIPLWRKPLPFTKKVCTTHPLPIIVAIGGKSFSTKRLKNFLFFYKKRLTNILKCDIIYIEKTREV